MAPTEKCVCEQGQNQVGRSDTTVCFTPACSCHNSFGAMDLPICFSWGILRSNESGTPMRSWVSVGKSIIIQPFKAISNVYFNFTFVLVQTLSKMPKQKSSCSIAGTNKNYCIWLNTVSIICCSEELTFKLESCQGPLASSHTVIKFHGIEDIILSPRNGS